MAITVGALALILAAMTVVKPLPEPVQLSTQTKISLEASSGAKTCGVLVILATALLYVVFW
jgi:hypothetical protein